MLLQYAVHDDIKNQKCDCVILGLFDQQKSVRAVDYLPETARQYLNSKLAYGDIQGRLEQTLLLHEAPGLNADRLLVIGCGSEERFDMKAWRKAMASAIAALKGTGVRRVLNLLPLTQVVNAPAKSGLAALVQEAIINTEYQLYRFSACKSSVDPEDDKKTALREMTFFIPEDEERANIHQALERGGSVAEGINWARELANLPGNRCTPSYLADQAQQLAQEHSDLLHCDVLEEDQMEELGMGALLSVSRGSREPAKLIVFEYRGGHSEQKPVVLVGKGLTFDAGGISLKPAAKMDEMKYDMCGGAAVLGVIKALSLMKLPLHVVAIVPSSENLPDGAANKPGDIVTSMSGKTIEILNTDAEGRLILCDALTYSQRYDAEITIDMATLTGACVVALGHEASGLFSNDDELSDAILAAGDRSGDRLWRLPLWEEYQPSLKSSFADMANVGDRSAGSITAACFLSRFVPAGRKWAHLDIAGSAYSGGAKKGATGRPVAMLMDYLCAMAHKNESR